MRATAGLVNILRLAAVFVAAAWISPGAAQTFTPASRVEAPGVGNLYRVAPNLYRGAQPTKEGFAHLSGKLGIKTVINLRHEHDDKAQAAGLPLQLQRVRFQTWHIGDDGGAKIVRALRLLREAEARGPVFVHCKHGSDRTGAIIALYRILYQGQDKESAISEMMQENFGFHKVWATAPGWANIPAYIRKADVEDLRRRVAAGSGGN